jgi:hypothetical protein
MQHSKEGSIRFNRNFKRAVIAFAVVEFVVMVVGFVYMSQN